jgi:hypothetical protein
MIYIWCFNVLIEMLNSQPRQVQNWIKTEAYNIHTICFYLFSFDCNLEKRGKKPY